MTRVPDPSGAPASSHRAPAPCASGLILSRSEIEALCAKASRGAGMAWGLAEEAGFAAGWLSVRGVDGPGALADHLAWAEGQTWDAVCPEVAPGCWTARAAGTMCPVALGATLCDFAALPQAALDGDGLSVGPVSRPVILLPFLAAIAKRLDHTVEVRWSGGRLAVTAIGGMTGALTDLVSRDAELLALHLATGDPAPAPSGRRARCSPDTFDRLTALALKTTVPPSAASRAGAGAGTSDND